MKGRPSADYPSKGGLAQQDSLKSSLPRCLEGSCPDMMLESSLANYVRLLREDGVL